MAVQIVSYAFPVMVAALWIGARRFPGERAFIPALFAAVMTAGMLLAVAANQPLAPVALAVAMALAVVGLADVVLRIEPPGRDDGDDHPGGGGGGSAPFEPIGPRGGGLPHPDSWESFEAAFWAHVQTLADERTPAPAGA